MIAEIRSFIKTTIASVDSGLKQNPSAFFDEDIGETILDKSYQIEIGTMVKTVRNSHTERQLPVIISIFGLGGRNQIERFDYLLDKAICIEDEITNIQNFNGKVTLTNIESAGITPSRLISNDDAFKIDINLTLTQAYSRE